MSHAILKGFPANQIKYDLIEFWCYVQVKLHKFIFVTFREKTFDA